MTRNVNLSGMAICLAGLRGGVAHALRASRKGKLDIPMWVAAASIAH